MWPLPDPVLHFLHRYSHWKSHQQSVNPGCVHHRGVLAAHDEWNLGLDELLDPFPGNLNR